MRCGERDRANGQLENSDAVAVRVRQLEITAGRNRDILLAVDGNRRAVLVKVEKNYRETRAFCATSELRNAWERDLWPSELCRWPRVAEYNVKPRR